jgi:hypothetical protein
VVILVPKLGGNARRTLGGSGFTKLLTPLGVKGGS